MSFSVATAQTNLDQSNSSKRAASCLTPRRARILADDDQFRVGSYVIHTPPTVRLDSNNLGARLATSSQSGNKSAIPHHYQHFKTKIATLNLASSSPSTDDERPLPSPRKVSISGQSGGDQVSSSEPKHESPALFHKPYQGPQEPVILSSPYKTSLAASQVGGLSPSSPRQTPRAIPKPSYGLANSNNKESKSLMIEVSQAKIQHLRQQQQHVVEPENKLAEPRVPRGVSRIPQVGNQQQSSMAEASKYLTFNKEQASSHVRLLRDELRTCSNSFNSVQDHNHSSPPMLPAQPKPVERQSKQQAGSTSQSRSTQQPVCEAFIMTGKSMLKLSCDESGQNNMGRVRPIMAKSVTLREEPEAAREEVAESRLKSVSLGKLSAKQCSNRRATHLNSNSASSGHCFSDANQHEEERPQQKLLKRHNEPDFDSASDLVVESRTSLPLLAQASTNDTYCNATLMTPELDSCNTPKAATASGIEGNSTHGALHPHHQHQQSDAPSIVSTMRAPPAAVETTKAGPIEKPLSLEALYQHDAIDACFPRDKSISICNLEHIFTPLKLVDSPTPPRDISNNSPDQRANSSSPSQITSPRIQADKLTETKEQADPVLSSSATSRKQLSTKPLIQPSVDHDDTGVQLPPNPTLASNDRDSARRLAKRLYNLSGFKRADICMQLIKCNPFTQLVADEYLELFDFRSMKLDAALRKFLSKLELTGETQERERILDKFSKRYYECNKDKFPNADTVQTLVCALVLLNTDLHGARSKRNKRPKLALGAFIDGLQSSLVDQRSESDITVSASGEKELYTFPRHLLVDLYESIKKRPLKCSDERLSQDAINNELDRIYMQQTASGRSNTLPTRRFVPGSNAPSSTLSASSRHHFKKGLGRLAGLDQDGNETSIEFRSGVLVRKKIVEPLGRVTPKGRRGWRHIYTTLRDLHLTMRPISASEASAASSDLSNKNRATQDMKNTVRIHHAFASSSSNYHKRQFVFHLRLADQTEFLLQAEDEQSMMAWVDTINFAAACMSSPALPSAITNSNGKAHHQMRIQRPILPSAYTKLSYWEQLIDHEDRLQRLKSELDAHLTRATQTKSANKKSKTEFIERIADLRQDIERHSVYVNLMRNKSNSPEAIILSKHPQIASLTPSQETIQSMPESE